MACVTLQTRSTSSEISLKKYAVACVWKEKVRFVQGFNWVALTYVQISKDFQCKIVIIFLPEVQTYVVGAQKNHLIETVLLSTHNICFG